MSFFCPSVNVPDLKTLAYKSLNSLMQSSVLGISCKTFVSIFNDKDLPNSLLKLNDTARTNLEFSGASSSLFSTMKSELNRLNSFEDKWTLTFINPIQLAAAGLFYLGIRDSVQCAFCRGVLSDWEEGDDPFKEHVEHFPLCPFLLSCEVGNVPMSGSKGIEYLQKHKAHPEKSGMSIGASEFTWAPKYGDMNHVDRRLRTFSNWPASLRPETLAESGFFYSGKGDQVVCFCCGGRLGDWLINDDPWTEHAKHFPSCAYVKFIKGTNFIESTRPPDINPRTNILSDSSHAVAQTAKDKCSTKDLQKDSAGVAPSACFGHSEPQSTSYNLPETQPAASSGSESAPSSSMGTTTTNKYLCKICMDNDDRVAFLPCGHSLACPNCAKSLSTCPMCREKIQHSVRIYFD